MSSMSPELCVLRAPARTFRELAASSDRGAWTLVRRPLLLMFAMGLTVSLSSSTRVSVRTVVDGMISFTFLPISEVLAMGVVYLGGDRRVPFTRVVDAFLVSNAPWLLWILAFCVWQGTMSATVISDTMARSLVASLLVPAGWAAYLDLQFFRVVLSRPGGAAATDLIIARVIGWTCALGYFFGIAAWAQIAAWFR
jgi:hypothetical protein